MIDPIVLQIVLKINVFDCSNNAIGTYTPRTSYIKTNINGIGAQTPKLIAIYDISSTYHIK